MNYEEKYKHALENFKKIKSANSDNKELVNFIEYEYPELRESEDERIRKEIIELVHFFYGSSTIYEHHVPEDDMIAWLEKQGEQKYIDESKPKFNVGDWITNGEYTWKVIDIKPLDYILQSQNGEVVDDTISYVDEEFHLWTIQDAKDGDVLSDEKPFIFRGFGDREHPHNPTAYCGISSSGTFILSTENEWWTADDFYPATKEQHDFLFQKMKEAGWKWDDEKKELKKIEQSHAWSEEDESMHTRCIGILGKCYMGELPTEVEEELNWLKSIKPNHWKPSEEQMEAIKFCCANFEEYDALKSLYNDLKGLNLC